MTAGIVQTCMYCGRPISGTAIYLCTLPYHPECTRGPQSVDDARIRQIVREEIELLRDQIERATGVRP